MKYDWEYHQTHYKRGGIFRFITALARLSGLIALMGLGFLNYLEWSLNSRQDFRIYLMYEFRKKAKTIEFRFSV